MDSSLWPFNEIIRRIVALESSVTAMKTKEATMANTIAELLPAITALRTQEEGLEALTANLWAQVNAIVAGALTPQQQADLDAAFEAVNQNATEVVAAINANSPPPPPPPPPPAGP